jgi:hypothetical protein
VFWKVRSCILFQLDFSLQAEKSRFRALRGGEAVFEAQSNSDGRDLRLQNEMLMWKTSQLGFPLERPVCVHGHNAPFVRHYGQLCEPFRERGRAFPSHHLESGASRRIFPMPPFSPSTCASAASRNGIRRPIGRTTYQSHKRLTLWAKLRGSEPPVVAQHSSGRLSLLSSERSKRAARSFPKARLWFGSASAERAN